MGECKKPKRLVSKESNSEKPKVSQTDDKSEIIKEILYQNYLLQQNRTRQRILDIISFMKFKGLERHPIYDTSIEQLESLLDTSTKKPTKEKQEESQPEPTPEPEPEPQNEEPRPPPAQDAEQFDIIDRLFSLIQIGFFFMLMFFRGAFGSMVSFIGLITLTVILKLYQNGWFRPQRRNNNNENVVNAVPEVNNNPQQRH